MGLCAKHVWDLAEVEKLKVVLVSTRIRARNKIWHKKKGFEARTVRAKTANGYQQVSGHI